MCNENVNDNDKETKRIVQTTVALLLPSVCNVAAAMASRIFTVALVFLVTVILKSVFVKCNVTSTSTYMEMGRDNFRDRHSRLITFNTDENSDINMEIAFSVPFLTIPVKKTMETTKGALANINLGAIVLSGMIVLGASFALPLVSYLISKKTSKTAEDDKSRSYDSVDWTNFFAYADQGIPPNNVDSSSCLQRIICWIVKNASTKVARGSASSGDKLVDGITSNEWFKKIVEGTFVKWAIQDGLNNVNCSKRYSKCKMNHFELEESLKYFMKTING